MSSGAPRSRYWEFTPARFGIALIEAPSCAMPRIVPPLDTLWPALAGAVVLVLGFRILFYALRAVAASSAFGRRTLLLGTGSLAQQIAAELASRPDAGDELVGLVGPE